MSAKPDGTRSIRPALTNVLNSISHGATPFIATFLLIHLSAPVMANLGGSSLASQTMLLGREFYQTPYGESMLVLGPITAHVLAGALKRFTSPKPTSQPRPLSTRLTGTGYAVAVFWLPVHYFIHRTSPKTPTPPINAVGPSELDFEFVKYGLKTWPFRMTFLYAGLVIGLTLHVTEAMGLLAYFQGKLKQTKDAINARTATGIVGVALPVFAGLFFIAREPSYLFPSMARRFHAVIQRHPLFWL
ncbi:hypothetical protein DL96DRAFT_1808954 [Flagelloscypha sp. PMI_526]|nr:hypothetical protein DL96DRAFT_1808954 [Flagelloscypha sp. PMI_526]